MKKLFTILLFISGVILISGMNISCADAPKAKDIPIEKSSKDDASSKDKNSSLTGKVVETMDSGGYTYINLVQDGKSTWVAIPIVEVKVGQEISVQPGFVMNNFKSKTLDRQFDSIVFSSGIAAGAAAITGVAPPPSSSVMPSDKTHSAIVPDQKTEQVKVEVIKVEKADGANAYTVAELFAKRAELDKKSIVLKGKVVKVGKAIMGKNWIHIQDGSGSASDKTNDIIVTSQDVPSVGDVVTATGTVYKDKDFGMGYFFNVIIEEGSIK